MKKVLIGIIVCVTAIAMTGASFVSAMPTEKIPGLKGMIGPAGNSNNGFIELWEKTPSGEWPIIEDGAWAKMRYSLEGETFDFHFNAHGLEPGLAYSLIYYPDPWPGEGLILLGEGTSNEDGHLLIKNSADIGVSLPYPLEAEEGFTDDNFPGAKVWLVLSGDVDVDSEVHLMTGWQPTEYLFEFDLITFNYVDPEALAADATSNGHGKPDKPEKGNNGKGLAKGHDK